MNREQQIARATALAGPACSFPGGDAARAEFDQILAQLEGHRPVTVRADERDDAPSLEAVVDTEAVGAALVVAPFDHRGALIERLETLVATGGYSPVVVAGTARTASGLTTFLRSCPAGFLADVQAQLDALAARDHARAADTRRAEALQQQRAGRDPQAELDADLLEDARARAEFENSDAGRHARLERLLGEIRDRLPAEVRS